MFNNTNVSPGPGEVVLWVRVSAVLTWGPQFESLHLHKKLGVAERAEGIRQREKRAHGFFSCVCRYGCVILHVHVQTQHTPHTQNVCHDYNSIFLWTQLSCKCYCWIPFLLFWLWCVYCVCAHIGWQLMSAVFLSWLPPYFWDMISHWSSVARKAG